MLTQALDIWKKHKHIILFLLTIIIIHTIWKFGKEASDYNRTIAFYGHDFSNFFNSIGSLWTQLVYFILFPIKGDVLQISGQSLSYAETHTGIRIVWGCVGIKEIIMTIFIIITAPGSSCKKLWYIPLAIIAILIVNLIRLLSITLIVHNHMELFNFVHEYVFRFVVYGSLFLIWLLWTEKVSS